ncbi:MAG: flagellar filament capping protein FliD [Planctomycetota bacterium]
MSGISTGVGLISGINTAQLIDQLMAIEQRPVNDLRARVKVLDTQRTMFLELSAKLLAVRNAVSGFSKLNFFKRFSAASTDENVLSAVASEDAAAGSTTLRVHSLVTNHAVISRGFADADRSTVGVGTLSVEVGQGRVNPSTDLDSLNGGEGVRRGAITITDRSGASADIDLTQAFTIDDVLDAINAAADINVHASVTGVASNGATGDRIVIEDRSGGAGNLIIADRIGRSTAADLGIVADVAADRVDGTDVLGLSLSTFLSSLNDGNGVDRFAQGAQGDDLSFTTSYGNFGVSLTDVLRLSTDLRAVNGGNGVRLGVIRITDRTGATADVDLTNAKTVQDVRDAINASGLKVSATTVNSRFLVTDTSDTTGPNAKKLKIEDVSGFAAADLGIAQEVDGSSINGRDIYRMATLGDLIRAINFAPGNNSLVEAALSGDGNGIALRALGFDNQVTVTAGRDSSGTVSGAGKDLGLLDASFTTNEPFESQRLLGGLNTVLLKSLKGGSGVQGGVVSFTDRLNRTATIDFTTANTLQEVIDRINADGTTSITASVNEAGNGIVIREESSGNSPLVISDVSGTLAADLGITGTFDPGSGNTVEGGNLQLQYVSRQTSLSDFNSGRGITFGTLRITDSQGAAHVVTLDKSLKNVGQVIDEINRVMPDTIEARVNDTGDGILITDTTGGLLPLTIADENGGQTATDLHLAGTAKPGRNFIDGTLETRIEVGPADSLSDIVRKLNNAGAGFTAAVVNDGGGINPFSLTLTSAVSGRRGELVIDSAGLDLGLDTLTKAQDAVVSVGTSGAGTPFLIRSSTNKLDGVVQGVSINLLSAKDADVTLTVNQDVDSVVEAIQGFVDKYNDVQKTIDDDTSFNQDTLQRGPLLGDSTVDLIRGRMQRVISQPFQGVSANVARLFSIGLRLGADSRLEFDEDKFRQAYEQSPRQVEELFSKDKTGFGAVLQDSLDELTRNFDGVIARKDDLLGDQQKVLNDRIDALNVLLAAKRNRLEAQFAGLELTLASLQGQQNALGTLSQLLST